MFNKLTREDLAKLDRDELIDVVLAFETGIDGAVAFDRLSVYVADAIREMVSGTTKLDSKKEG